MWAINSFLFILFKTYSLALKPMFWRDAENAMLKGEQPILNQNMKGMGLMMDLLQNKVVKSF